MTAAELLSKAGVLAPQPLAAAAVAATILPERGVLAADALWLLHTPGAVVTSADTLMTLVPDDAGIEVEALVENKDIGFVREGQQVAIKLDAFPFTRYGLLSGVVRKLGHDAATPQQIASTFGSQPSASDTPGGSAASSNALGEFSYPARIALDQDWIMVDGTREPIRSGMHVSAEVKTGDRRAIDYVLSPVMQAVSEAGREK